MKLTKTAAILLASLMLFTAGCGKKEETPPANEGTSGTAETTATAETTGAPETAVDPMPAAVMGTRAQSTYVNRYFHVQFAPEGNWAQYDESQLDSLNAVTIGDLGDDREKTLLASGDFIDMWAVKGGGLTVSAELIDLDRLGYADKTDEEFMQLQKQQAAAMIGTFGGEKTTVEDAKIDLAGQTCAALDISTHLTADDSTMYRTLVLVRRESYAMLITATSYQGNITRSMLAQCTATD